MDRLKTLKTAAEQNDSSGLTDVTAAAGDSKPDLQHTAATTQNPLPATLNRSAINPKSQIPNPKSKDSQLEPCYTVNLGMMEYNRARKLQSSLVAARTNGLFSTDTILFLEHPAVFTLGRRGGRDYLKVDESFLTRAEIPIVKAERGGYITYHGPGQLVVYPIIDLEARRLGVPDFVSALEEIMLQSVKTWGLRAQRNSANAGIWIGNHKMGSIGIALRRGISFHGLALNVNVDLTPFSWIQPCGLDGVSMTSVRRELGREIPMSSAVQTVRRLFNSVLGFKLNDISYTELKELL